MARLTEEQKAQIQPLYESNISCETIGELFGVTSEAIRKWMIKLGIERRDFEHRQAPRAFPVNHDFFETIDTEAKAYWLGFFAADGSITGENTVGILLQVTDKEHLERYQTAIESEHPIHEYARAEGQRGKPYVRLSFHSRKMMQDLAQYTITPNKTFTVRWPRLEAQWLRHYLRGYFDGDGTAAAKQHPGRRGFAMRFSLCGNEEFLDECQSYLMSTCEMNLAKLYIQKRWPKHRSLNYTGAAQIMRIAHLMYDDATVYLPRKRDIFAPYLPIYPPAGIPYRRPRRMSDRLPPAP